MNFQGECKNPSKHEPHNWNWRTNKHDCEGKK